MVKTIRALLVAAAVLGGVSGCNLGVGIFPDRLTSYEGYADLAGLIEPDRIWDFEFHQIRDSRPGSGHPEYFVLVNDDPDPAFVGICLVVYDAYLRVLGKYTREELDAMSASSFWGRGAMVDANGRIVVGNRAFTVGTRGLSYDDSMQPQPGHQGLAVIDPLVLDPNISDIHTNNDLLEYNRYSASWVPMPPPLSVDIGPDPWYKFAGFWLRDADLLFILTNDVPPARVLSLDPVQFATGGLVNDLVLNYPDWPITAVPSNNIAWETLGYIQDGTTAAIAAYRWDANRYFLLDFVTDTVLETSDEVPDDEQPRDNIQRHFYGRESGWYILDRKAMTLERRAWWWK
jgi:hypothetical protein